MKRVSPLAQVNTPTSCPLTAAVTAIGGKWNLVCLYWLDTGPKRFSQLQRLMPDISHKVLAETLRVLEGEDLVCRRVLSQAPVHVEYAISEYGEGVRPLIHAVREWGRGHLDREVAIR